MMASLTLLMRWFPATFVLSEREVYWTADIALFFPPFSSCHTYWVHCSLEVFGESRPELHSTFQSAEQIATWMTLEMTGQTFPVTLACCVGAHQAVR
jgi:hypothetical protein